MFSRLNRIPAFDGQTDRQTAWSALCIASRSKNASTRWNTKCRLYCSPIPHFVTFSSISQFTSQNSHCQCKSFTFCVIMQYIRQLSYCATNAGIWVYCICTVSLSVNTNHTMKTKEFHQIVVHKKLTHDTHAHLFIDFL